MSSNSFVRKSGLEYIVSDSESFNFGLLINSSPKSFIELTSMYHSNFVNFLFAQTSFVSSLVDGKSSECDKLPEILREVYSFPDSVCVGSSENNGFVENKKLDDISLLNLNSTLIRIIYLFSYFLINFWIHFQCRMLLMI